MKIFLRQSFTDTNLNRINFYSLIIILALLFSGKSIYSQVLLEWVDVYDDNISNRVTGSLILADEKGNVYMGGYRRIGNQSGDIIVIKYSDNGIKKWISSYNGPGNGSDLISDMVLDKRGNIYITGRSSGSEIDYVTIKYDSSGTQQWVSRYTGNGNHRDASYAIATDTSGNIFITGESYNDSTFKIECVTIKYNELRTMQWIAKYRSNSATGFALTTDISGNVFVAGRDNGNFLTIKYDNNGFQKWSATYNGTFNEEDLAEKIGLDSSGNVYVAGSSIGDLHYSDYATVKYDSSGNEMWVRRYNGSANYEDQLNGMVVDKKGNIYITGNGTQTGSGYDYTTIKYNSSGDVLWIAKYNNGLNDIASDLKVDDNGSVYVTGESDGSGSRFDYATVKYDSSGNEMWSIRYSYSSDFDDEARNIVLDENKNVYITGISNIPGNNHANAVTIKYSQTLTSINNSNKDQTNELRLNQNYPNPFNPTTKIIYQLKTNGYIELKVYDLLGHQVSTIVNQKQNAGSYEVEFNGSSLASGIYFYELEVDGSVIDTKRMILIK